MGEPGGASLQGEGGGVGYSTSQSVSIVLTYTSQMIAGVDSERRYTYTSQVPYLD